MVSRVSTAGLEVFSSKGGDVIADLVGYYKGSAAGASKSVPSDPAPPAIAPPYWMVAPSISRMNSGRSVAVGRECSTPSSNSGRIWHWTGTGTSATTTTTSRRSATAPTTAARCTSAIGLKDGDRIYVSTGDQRTYVYKYVRRDLTSKNNTQILAATQKVSGESLSLIACTVGFDRSKSAYPNAWAPTSLEYRIIVTFALEFWTDDIPLQ